MAPENARAAILEENARRRQEVENGLYAPWQPAEIFMKSGRLRDAAALLRRLDVFPREGCRVLEIGCGEGGWLPDLLGWRLAARDLFGVDFDPRRLIAARRRLPGCRFFAADGAALPFADASFDFTLGSTVFSSLLEPALQERVAREIVRVLRPGGVHLHYDLAMNNPANGQVRGLSPGRVRELFPSLSFAGRRTTLAPPLCRRLAPLSPALATALESLPFLRSHLVAVLRKSSG